MTEQKIFIFTYLQRRVKLVVDLAPNICPSPTVMVMK